LTVGGAIKNPVVVKVPIGTRVADLFSALGIKVEEGYTVLDGGPSMGKVINPATYSVTKTTKGILVLPDDTQAIISKKTNEKMAVARA
jgi:Na+-translocating ferredoxin:NAD+ oxidoreductase RnfC subunit